MVIKVRDDRQMKALTGLGIAEFDRLLPVFSAVYEAEQQRRYEQAVQSGNRQRKRGGGRKSKLPTMADKLFFVLYYFKAYPTFDQLGVKFDLARSKAHKRLYELSPLLHEALVQLDMMPAREFQSVADLMQALDGIDEIIIDATERAYRRPQDAQQQQAHYSGKKNSIR
ncbi:MAG: hypothetical protein UZ22_OP11002000362 [Microgenomates bacterium OLB23]|nr:MAG: hypothetical protein UZ22_OP11002000362 [Microgenomates bacterium OLB23]